MDLERNRRRREALFSTNVLIQRTRDVDNNIYCRFLNFERAFDRVNHNKLIEIRTGINCQDLRTIKKTYNRKQ